jgi:hypothetical protein
METKNYWRACPFRANVVPYILLCRDKKRMLILCCRSLSHSSMMASVSCWRFWGTCRWRRICLAIVPQRCSMGDEPGFYGGHSKGSTFWACRYSQQIRATYGRALSCCIASVDVDGCGRMRSWYHTTFQIFIFWSCAMPYHTMTDHAPKQFLSTTHASAYRSPRRLYTRLQPSGRCRVNLDSLENKTFLHCHMLKWYRSNRRNQSRSTPFFCHLVEVSRRVSWM